MHFRRILAATFVLVFAAVLLRFALLCFRFVGLRLACSINLAGSEPGKHRKPHDRTRNAPTSNARRARAAREQGRHTIPQTCNLDARVALPTLALLPLVMDLRSGSSRCSACSPRLFRRLQGLRLSSLSRFPFHDSQVSDFM